MRALQFAIPLLFLATAPLGFMLGGGWSFLTLAVVPLTICVFDWVLGFDPGRAPHADGLAYRLVPWIYIALQIAITIWAGMTVADPRTSLVEDLGLTASVGMTAGIFGILAAHEMVHRRSAPEQAAGLAMLASVGYMHFRIAHIHGHHVRGATFEDPTSARRGENAYRFIVRSVLGQAQEAWTFETARLRLGKNAIFSISNRMLRYLALEAVLVAAIAAFSLRALAFWLAQAVIAVILLELFNYIAHYGLSRRRRAAGGYERLGARHSWNSARRMNNWSLFNMGRHSDHHSRPTSAYQRLEAQPDSPQLPTGYGGAIVMALIPPLWSRVMDPRVDFWMISAAD